MYAYMNVLIPIGIYNYLSHIFIKNTDTYITTNTHTYIYIHVYIYMNIITFNER